MKTYLVTGAAGFIGANFVKYMLKKYGDIAIVILDKLTYAGNLGTIKEELKDSRVEFVRGDIANAELVSSIFARREIDYVVNFAAESHVDRSITNPQLFLQTNILGTQNMLECAKKAWTTGKDDKGYPTYLPGKKFLQVSTDEVYGSLTKDFDVPQPLHIEDENVRRVVKGRTKIQTYGRTFFTEETPLDPRSPYSSSKTGADLIVRAYHETYKMPVNITRCSNNYGPYHFPEKLIPLIIKNILEGRKLPVYGKGDNVRDWLYVEDHAKAIDMVLAGGRVGEIQYRRFQRRTEHQHRKTYDRYDCPAYAGRASLSVGSENFGREYQLRPHYLCGRPVGARYALCHRSVEDSPGTGLVPRNAV